MPSGFSSLTMRIALTVAMVLIGGPCGAWLYDGGQAQHAGVVVKEPAPPVWAAAPFVVSSQARATRFGAAIGKIYGGSKGMGYRVYLSQTLDNAPQHAIASWTIAPQTAILQYYYVEPPSPILLAPNTPYYMVFAPNSNNFSGAISWSTKGYYGLGTADYGKSWYYLALPLCVRVDGYTVPEPACVVLFAAGLIGLAIRPLWKMRCESRRGAGRAL